MRFSSDSKQLFFTSGADDFALLPAACAFAAHELFLDRFLVAIRDSVYYVAAVFARVLLPLFTDYFLIVNIQCQVKAKKDGAQYNKVNADCVGALVRL